MTYRYPEPTEEIEIIKTGLVYDDGKIYLPKKVAEIIGVKPGESVAWMLEKTKNGQRIYLESSVRKT